MFELTQTIRNEQSIPVEVIWEPWGDVDVLAAGSSFRVVARSDREGALEVVPGHGTIAVYAWVGATLQVFRGDEVINDLSVAVPDAVPPGMSPRTFVDRIFGGPGEPRGA